MRHFMDQRLDRLHLTHILLQSDAIFHRVEIALRAGCNLLEADRDRAGHFQCFEKILILRHIAA